jgi:hypothetical protein
MTQYDLPSLYQFLAHTPEQGLRKMLIDPKTFSEVHFNLMIKIVRAGDEAKFCSHAEKVDFPKIKMGPAEMKIKESFWQSLEAVCKSRGLLTSIKKAAA